MAKIGALAFVAAVGLNLCQECGPIIVVSPFEVSESATKIGYSPALLQGMMLSHLVRIDSKARSQIRKAEGESEGSIEIELAGARISHVSMRRLLRQMVNSEETVISGAFTNEPHAVLRILIARSDGDIQSFKVDPESLNTGKSTVALHGFDELLEHAALEAAGRIDPIVASAYLTALESRACSDHNECEYTRSLAMSREMFESPDDERRFSASLALAFIFLKKSQAPLGLDSARANSRTVALKYAEEAKRLYPDRAAAYIALGHVALAEGSVQGNEHALDLFQKAAERDPTIASIYADMGKALVYNGKEAEGLEYFKRAAELDREDARTYDEWGKALAKLGDGEEALRKFEEAIKWDPNLYDAHKNAAAALSALGRYADALERLDSVLSIARIQEPDNPLLAVHEDRGKVLCALRDTKGAEGEYRYVTSFQHKAPWRYEYIAAAYVDWGACLFEAQRFAEAEDKFRKAGQHPYALQWLGKVATRGSRFSEAEAHLVNAINVLEPDPSKRAHLAAVHLDLGKLFALRGSEHVSRAAYHFEVAAASDIKGSNVRDLALHEHGKLLANQGRLDDALGTFRMIGLAYSMTSVALQADIAALQVARAEWGDVGEPLGALHALRAKELRSGREPPAWLESVLGDAYLAAGELVEARACYERARDSAPRQAFPLVGLARVLLTSPAGQQEAKQAAALLDEAVRVDPADGCAVTMRNLSSMVIATANMPTATPTRVEECHLFPLRDRHGAPTPLSDTRKARRPRARSRAAALRLF